MPEGRKPAREMTSQELAESVFPPEVIAHLKEVAQREPPKGGRKRKSSHDESTGE